MRIGQIVFNKFVTAAIFENGTAYPIPGHSLLNLVRRSETENVSLEDLATEMAVRHGEPAVPVLPIDPPEVWASGCTYQISSEFRDEEHGEERGIYNHVYSSPRPELFMKGTSRVCVGPGEKIGIRKDSKFTAPEPELSILLGKDGKILGYTLGNDVSAWDIERENPLYLPQSKIYEACVALGPYFLTPDELGDPYKLDITCTIKRNNDETFHGSVNTSRIQRKFEDIVEYLCRSNPLPSGSVLMTGTGIIVPQSAALAPGDVCTISCPEIGQLSNPAATV